MELKKIFEKFSPGVFFKKYKYLLIAIAAGVVLLCIPTGADRDRTANTHTIDDAAYDLEQMEEKLADAISKIDGAGKVKVVLTLKSDWEKVLATDRTAEADKDAESFHQSESFTTVTVNGPEGDEVVVLERIYPKYQGALVVCQGGDNVWVKTEVLNAVSRLTGLGTDKITVTKMKRD